MNKCDHLALRVASCVVIGSLLVQPCVSIATAASHNEARVTRIVRDVKLIPEKEKPRPAELDAKVVDGTGVRTGDQSRSELTFVDLTIERLGANTIFSFTKAGRNVQLDSGSTLLCVPKNSGGGQITANQISVAITGTTVIMNSKRGGRDQLTVLEGGARVSLRKNPADSAKVLGGQMIDVPPGATKLPPVVNVDVNQVMKNDPLVSDFGPLPSRFLINEVATNSPPPSGGGIPGFIPPLVGSVVGIPLGPGPGVRTGGGNRGGNRRPTVGQTGSGSRKTKAPGQKDVSPNTAQTNSSTVNRSRPTPTPAPKRKPKGK